jgi:hypothetical protein
MADEVTLECWGRGDIRTAVSFQITRSIAGWRYVAWDPGRADFFEAKFGEGPAGTLYLEVIAHNGAASFFTARGIPEAVFRHLSLTTGCTIISSTNTGTKRSGNEYRSLSAERMWQGLVRRGRATYEVGEDRYYYRCAPP